MVKGILDISFGDKFIKYVISYSFRMMKVLFLLLVMESASKGQVGSTGAAISGLIVDGQKAVIGGAKIEIINIDTNFRKELVSSEDGSFLISLLKPGNYQIVVNQEGFATKTQQVNLNIGTTVTMVFNLEVSSTSGVFVEVSANVDIDKTSNSKGISNKVITSLPQNTRNFVNFAFITSQVVASPFPNTGVAASSPFSFNGLSPRSNNVTIDGLDNNDLGSGSLRSIFSQDAVREFQILTNNYDAQFGRALGAVINVVTKSGTNSYQGNTFFTQQSEKVGARDVFAGSKFPRSQYQFGNTFGGPIKKDKVFFFTAFERLSIKDNRIVTIDDRTVLAAKEQNFFVRNGAIPFPFSNSSFLARFDLNVLPRNLFSLRYNFGGNYNGGFEQFGALTDISASAIQRLKDNSVAINNTFLGQSGKLVNETRFIYSIRKQSVLPLDDGPQVNIIAPEGSVTFGRRVFTPSFRQENIYQISNIVNIANKNNLYKFGVDFNYINLPPKTTSLPIFPGGFASFTQLDFSALTGIANLPVFSGLQAFAPSLRTSEQKAFLRSLSVLLPSLVDGFPKGLPLADLSLPLFFSQSFGNPSVSFKTKLFSAFIQDSIRLKPNINLNIGFRYDINRIEFNPKNAGNYSPRIGIAYRPGKINNLALHGSYGLFFGTPLFGQTFSTQVTKDSALQQAVIPFPFSIIPFSLPGHRFAEANISPPNTLIPQLSFKFTLDPNLRNSYTQQINTGIDYLFKNSRLSLNYSFVRGVKLVAGRQINPVVRPIVNNPLQSRIEGRVDAKKGDIIEFESAFDSYYHGLTFSAYCDFKAFNFLASYTFSKSIDNLFDILSGIADGSNNSLRPGDERGLSLSDVRNRFVVSGIWDLSSISRSKFLKDFEISTIFVLESGRPYNLLAGVDLNLDGDNPPFDRVTGLGRNVGIKPGFSNVDIRITRSLKLHGKSKTVFFIDVFNLFNKVNINEIDRTFTPNRNGAFDLPPQENGRYIVLPERYRSAFSTRQAQFGIRFIF